MLYIAIGPPASGKSTWVLANASPGDVVIDFDRLAVALTGDGGVTHSYSSAVKSVAIEAWRYAVRVAIRLSQECDVYIVHANPSEVSLGEYRRNGARIVTFDPGESVVRERCARERPLDYLGYVDDWYKRTRIGGW